MRQNPVTVEVTTDTVSVLIRGLPHLILRRMDLTAIQSYIREGGVRSTVYFIEFTVRGSTIVCDYEKRDVWEAVLAALYDAKVFAIMQGERPLPGSA
jgi:hypothetical protein